MALAKLPITIIRDSTGQITGATIPQSQENLMNGWLEENHRMLRAGGAKLAREIQQVYPGGLEAWSRDADYPIKFEG